MRRKIFPNSRQKFLGYDWQKFQNVFGVISGVALGGKIQLRRGINNSQIKKLYFREITMKANLNGKYERKKSEKVI